MDGLLCIYLLRILYVEPAEYQLRLTLIFPSILICKYLKKSHSSAAASISACHAFFPCPSIVAAIISYLYFPLIRSAALRNTAARSANGKFSHAGFAARADSMAFETSAELALEYLAMVEECAAGLAWVRMEDVFTCPPSVQFLKRRYAIPTSLPPMKRGTSSGAFFFRASRADWSFARFSEPLL